MDDIATTHSPDTICIEKHPWSTPWHSGKVGSMRPFLRETREGDIDLEAKQLMYGS